VPTSKILVTGGTGFVGHWMRETQPEGLDVTYLNTRDYNIGLWHKERWNAIVHLAPVCPDIVLGCAKRLGIRLLYCSSGIVYHPENDNVYRQNKVRWEEMCRESGVDVVIARLFTFSGARLSADHAIVAFEMAAEENKPLTIWGDGNAVRSYMHGSEMGRWMWAILFKGARGAAYDVGSDEPVTLLELAKRYSDNIIIQGGKDAMPVYLPVDTARTRRLLDE